MLTKKSIPNMLTLGRALIVPLALGFIIVEPNVALPLFVLFVTASVTDYFDGYLARIWKATSALGAMLDPVADKLLVALMLLYLATYSFAPMVPIAIILLREIYISALREFMALRGMPLPVSSGGKWKTATQMFAISFLLGAKAFMANIPVTASYSWDAGIVVLWLSALLSLITAVDYTRAAMPHLKKSSD